MSNKANIFPALNHSNSRFKIILYQRTKIYSTTDLCFSIISMALVLIWFAVPLSRRRPRLRLCRSGGRARPKTRAHSRNFLPLLLPLLLAATQVNDWRRWALAIQLQSKSTTYRSCWMVEVEHNYAPLLQVKWSHSKSGSFELSKAQFGWRIERGSIGRIESSLVAIRSGSDVESSGNSIQLDARL